MLFKCNNNHWKKIIKKQKQQQKQQNNYNKTKIAQEATLLNCSTVAFKSDQTNLMVSKEKKIVWQFFKSGSFKKKD